MPGRPTRGGFRPGPPRTGGGPRPGGGRPGGGRGRGPNTNGASGERYAQVRRAPARPEEPVILPAVISVGDLSERLMLSPTEVIKALIGVGVFANINQQVDFAT